MINHGTWTRYEPETLPFGVPEKAMFWRNSVGVDWYDFVYKLRIGPQAPLKKFWVYDNMIISISEDLSAMVPYDGATLFEVSFGEELPQGIGEGSIFHPEGISFEFQKGMKIQEIKTRGDEVMSQGFEWDFGAPYGIQHLQLRNAEDKQNWQTVLSGSMAAVMMQQGDQPGPIIRTAENNNIQITYMAAVEMLTSLIDWAQQVFSVAWAKQDTARAATNEDELNSISVDSEWP